MLTGSPTLQNSTTALNTGADAYPTKLVKIEELLEAVKAYLLKQSKERDFDEQKVGQFVETQLRKMSRL